MTISGYETYNSILNSGGIFAVVNFYIFLTMISGIIKMINSCMKKKKAKTEEFEGGNKV